jgi:hypothetical protein
MIENWAMFNIMYSVGLLIVKLEAAPKKTSVRVEGTAKVVGILVAHPFGELCSRTLQLW